MNAFTDHSLYDALADMLVERAVADQELRGFPIPGFCLLWRTHRYSEDIEYSLHFLTGRVQADRKAPEDDPLGILNAVASILGTTPEEVQERLASWRSGILVAVERAEKREDIDFGKFGWFACTVIPSAAGRNPKTGERISIPELRHARYNASLWMVEKLNYKILPQTRLAEFIQELRADPEQEEEHV